jgi:predicted PurR-regulated permease PerM
MSTPLDALISKTDDMPASDEPQGVQLRMPVDIRSISLGVLATLAAIYTLSWAKAVFIPLLLGVMASYALTPLVDRLERWRQPRVVGAALLLSALVGGLGWAGYALGDDAQNLVRSLPEVAQKLRQTVQRSRVTTPRADNPIDKVQQAASELEKAAGANASRAGPPKVQIEKPVFDIRDYLWSSTLGLVELIGQAVIVLFLTFFLLVSGDSFRRKMVKIAGPRFAEKKLTVQALDEITGQIQRYLLVQVLTIVLVGVATGLSFVALGVQHAAVLGLFAGVLNFIPYIGAILFTAVAAAVALLQFGSLDSVLLVAFVSLLIHTVSGYAVMPWLTSRAGRMNAVTVFIGVLAWGWLWGLWGLLLGVPILMIVKAVCDRVDDLHPIGELLGS